MQKHILESLTRLTDDELAARVQSLAVREQATAASVIAHLAEMDTRNIHLRAGYPRLYDYCLKVLHLSEWEAWNRIEAGRVARRFPILFDMLEEGSIHLTGIKLLAPHLTDENHRRVLESARWKSKLAIGEIVARLHPLPDVPTPDAYELRCARHNDYESRLYFGKRRRGDGEVREKPAAFGARSFGTELVPEQIPVDRGAGSEPIMNRPG